MRLAFSFKGIALLVIAGVIVAGLFVFGILDWNRTRATLAQTAKNVGHSAGSGSSSMGGEPDASGSAVRNAEACRENLRRLQSAKRAVGTKTGVNVGDASWDAVLKEIGGKKPTCPSGGTYILGNYQVNVRCSVGANSSTDTKDDHLVPKF